MCDTIGCTDGDNFNQGGREMCGITAGNEMDSLERASVVEHGAGSKAGLPR